MVDAVVQAYKDLRDKESKLPENFGEHNMIHTSDQVPETVL